MNDRRSLWTGPLPGDGWGLPAWRGLVMCETHVASSRGASVGPRHRVDSKKP